MGAVTAMFAAVDAAARLWDPDGAWRGLPGPRALYGWRAAWRSVAMACVAAVSLLALPLLALLLLALAYPICLVLALLWPPIGLAVVARWYALTSTVVGPDVLASLVPRAVTLTVVAAAAVALTVYARGQWAGRAIRHSRGALWWRALGAPLDTQGALDWALDGFWRFVCGATGITQPTDDDLGRRYAELLGESMGQPGYRELLLVAHDLDSRRDVVFAHVSAPWRKRLTERASGHRAGEFVDLAGAGRGHMVDALAAALSPPIVGEPRAVAFASESYWRGETHRLCDRPGAAARLLREVAEVGVTQVIFVAATSPRTGPHQLSRPGLCPRDRIGDAIDSLEAAAFDDAIDALRPQFGAFFIIRPDHNPLGALAFGGRTDERSDRRVAIAELVDRGYEDAYRQFLEPVIGASGEQIHGATVVSRTPAPDDLPFKQQA